MPKRKDKENTEYLLRKIKKLEKKIRRRQPSSRSSSSDKQTSIHEDINAENSIGEFDGNNDIEPIFNEELNPNHSIQPEASTPSLTAEPTSIDQQSEIDHEILELLGETPSKTKKLGPPIQNELAIRWEHLVTSGLSKEKRKELIQQYLIPENCLKLEPPQLNAEIKAALSDILLKKDKAIETKQMQQGIALSCIGQALTNLFSKEEKDRETIKLLLDAGRLLCDHQHTESMSRRSFVCSTIRKDIKDHLYNTEIDSFLFGEKLPETLKAAKAISRSGSEIKNKYTKPPGQNLKNQRAPLHTNSRQPGVARRAPPAGAINQRPRRQPLRPPPPPPLPPLQPLLPPPPPPPQRSYGRTQLRK